MQADPVVYLMRGLPACGKSTAARTLAGATGVVLETDAFFRKQNETGSTAYHFRQDLLPAAQEWNFVRFMRAINTRASPIVVDRGNGLNAETYRYARHAVDQGYRVELREPESPWWTDIRAALAAQPPDPAVLDHWAATLAERSEGIHRVPAATIRKWMIGWRVDLTVADILAQRATRN